MQIKHACNESLLYQLMPCGQAGIWGRLQVGIRALIAGNLTATCGPKFPQYNAGLDVSCLI